VLIAIFSAYLTFLGWRALARKHPAEEPATASDWAAAFVAGAAGGGMIALGFLERGQLGGFSPVLYVLGSICIGTGARSIYQFFRPPVSRTAWLFAHFGNMLAAYIATVTAFSAVNFHFLNPVWLRWLWPSVVGTAVITYYTVRYKTKLAGGSRISQLVTVRDGPALSSMQRHLNSAAESVSAVAGTVGTSEA
jgi:FtsH-binding integral membrane protein